MQIPKPLLAVCAVLVGAVALYALGAQGQAADPDAIARAREALRKKMADMNAPAQPATAAPAPTIAPVPPPTPAPAPAPAPAVAPAAPNLPPSADPAAIAKAREAMRQKMQQLAPQAPAAPAPQISFPPAANPDAIAKAREAMRQKMQEIEQGQRPVMPPAQPTPPTQPAVATIPPATAPATITMPPAASPEAIEKAREAMRKKWSELPVEPAPAVALVPPQPARAQSPVAQAKPQPARTPEGYLRPEAPPLPISAEKQQQLAELLKRYRADEITPEQYHAERARIISGQ